MPLDEALKNTISQLEASDREELLLLLQQQEQPQPKRKRSGSEEGSQEEGHLPKSLRKDSVDSSSKNSTTSNSSQIIYTTEGMITASINEGFVNSRSSTPDQEHSNSSETASPLNLVDISFQSNVTTMGDARFNSQVLLTIDPTKINGQISISFTTERSDTSLGSVQGDHTIPERLLLEFIAKKIAGKTLEEITNTLHDDFRSVVENFDNPSIPNLPTKPEIIPYTEGDDNIRKLGIRFQNSSNVAKYISEMIDRYNHLPLSVLPKDGHAAVGEGPKVSSNMNMLRAIDKFLSIATDIEGEISTEDSDSFYKQAVIANGAFTRGMKDFFGLRSIDEVRETYPDTEEGRRNFSNAFQEKCSEAMVGGILSEIFDFPHRNSLEIAKDVERTQENLHILTKRCTKVCLGSFPQIEEKLDHMGIGIEFEQRVIQKSVDFKIGKGPSATTLSGSWSGKVELQDWDSVFPLDGDRVAAALENIKSIYLGKLDSGSLKDSREIVGDANMSFEAMGVKFKLVDKEVFAENCNFEAVINGMLQHDKLAPISGRLPPITREDLLSLFQEKSQELGQSQRADERGRK